MEEFLDGAARATANPRPGSTWERNLQRMQELDRRDLVQLAQSTINHIAASVSGPASEYAAALADAVMRRRPYEHPALASSRSLHEIGFTLCWLIDNDTRTESRLARWAGAELSALQGALEIYASMDIKQAISETRTSLAQAQARLTDMGFELVYKGKPRDHEVRAVRFGSTLEPIQPKFSDLAAGGGEQATVAYSVLSGATHSRAWFVAQSGAPAATIRATALGQAAWIWAGVVREVGRYTGEDHSHPQKRLRELYEATFEDARCEMIALAQSRRNPFAPLQWHG